MNTMNTITQITVHTVDDADIISYVLLRYNLQFSVRNKNLISFYGFRLRADALDNALALRPFANPSRIFVKLENNAELIKLSAVE